MTQEEKDLLLQDLCARLPYGIECKILETNEVKKLGSIQYDGENTLFDFWEDDKKIQYGYQLYLSEFKPYLFPMSSMTKKQKKDLLLTTVKKKGLKLFSVIEDGIVSNDKEEQSFANFSINWINFSNKNIKAYIGWLNKNHFDIYGLIPMGLAVDATGLKIYNNKK